MTAAGRVGNAATDAVFTHGRGASTQLTLYNYDVVSTKRQGFELQNNRTVINWKEF
jgi:hypothetical protein